MKYILVRHLPDIPLIPNMESGIHPLLASLLYHSGYDEPVV